VLEISQPPIRLAEVQVSGSHSRGSLVERTSAAKNNSDSRRWLLSSSAKGANREENGDE
jgi:hypothetical protein